MRKVIFEKRFKKDAKKHAKVFDMAAWREVLTLLCSDEPGPARYKDHALVGNWGGFRECHIKPDLLLIYRLEGEDYVQLVRLGSHAQLFS